MKDLCAGTKFWSEEGRNTKLLGAGMPQFVGGTGEGVGNQNIGVLRAPCRRTTLRSLVTCSTTNRNRILIVLMVMGDRKNVVLEVLE